MEKKELYIKVEIKEIENIKKLEKINKTKSSIFGMTMKLTLPWKKTNQE